MSISKRNTKNGVRWLPIVYLGTDPITKKQIQECGHMWELRRDAVQEEAEMKSRLLSAPASKDRTVMTFQELVQSFQESREWEKLSDRTKDDYEYYLKRVMLPIFGTFKIKAITYDHVQTWVDEMEKDWCAATLVKPFRQFKNIMSFAVKRRLIPYNPCVDVELPTVAAARAIRAGSDLKTWTPDQISTFLSWEAVRESKYFPMLLISFTTAARPGEVCGLWAKDFDGEYLAFKNGIDTKGRITNLKNEWAHRKVYAGPQVARAIKTVQLWQLKCKLLLGQDYIDDGHLFRHETGAPIRPDVYSKAFADLLKRYNEEHAEPLPVIPLYNARHSWATNARGVYEMDPQIIAAIMGHSTIHTAMENYINVTDSRLRQELQKAAFSS